jgi:hypothetical protein
LSIIIAVVLSLSLSPSLSLSLSYLPFSRKTDDESEQGTNAASIMEERERRGNATSARAKEEHAKEFEGFSMKTTAVSNMVFVSREYSMIASRL